MLKKYAIKINHTYLIYGAHRREDIADARLYDSREKAESYIIRVQQRYPCSKYDVSIIELTIDETSHRVLLSEVTDDPDRRFLPPPFDNYSITKEGDVYSHYKEDVKQKTTWVNNTGYEQVELWENQKRHAKFVHRLVLRAFDGEPREGEWCRHLDGDRTHNSIDNLKWGTPLENSKDKVQHGTALRRLSDREAYEIWDKYNNEGGWSYSELSEEYGISTSGIGRVVHEKRYKDAIKRGKNGEFDTD